MNKKYKLIVFPLLIILLLFINCDKIYDKHILLTSNEYEIPLRRRK